MSSHTLHYTMHCDLYRDHKDHQDSLEKEETEDLLYDDVISVDIITSCDPPIGTNRSSWCPRPQGRQRREGLYRS